ncbi:MAG: hypothetical protein E7E23_24620, partial [Paenibacillus sp.]|uniref:hypothetical protein n=1 Tax=Paenibacillus sp. TaxID=58172 RepID=UPI0029021359
DRMAKGAYGNIRRIIIRSHGRNDGGNAFSYDTPIFNPYHVVYYIFVYDRNPVPCLYSDTRRDRHWRSTQEIIPYIQPHLDVFDDLFISGCRLIYHVIMDHIPDDLKTLKPDGNGF